MTKKYELTTDTKVVFGKNLFRIKALVSFGDVTIGDLGGFVEKEENLAQVSGNAWVSGNALVSGDARVYGDARVSGNALVSGNARVYGNALVSGDARVSGNAQIMWFSKVGSENGTLTAFRDKDKNILITRGCFFGPLKEFEKQVKSRHRSSATGKEYAMLIEFIKLRFKNLDKAGAK